jgi:hypothetical protein
VKAPKDPAPRLLLSVNRGEVASGRDVEWGAHVLAKPLSIEVRRSVLTLSSRATRAVVMETPDAFHLVPGERTGAMTSNSGPVLSADLSDGDYRAVWTVNGLSSNVVSFRIDHTFTVERAAPLVITLLEEVDGRRDPTRILVQLTNKGSAAIDLPGALAGAELLADGVALPRNAPLLWAGPSLLLPGKSWGTLEELSGYGVPAGARRVALRMAGATSAEIDVGGVP